jgi:hypothetical protein
MPKPVPKYTLEQQLKDIASATAPSMVPGPAVPPPPAKEEEVIPAVGDIVNNAKERLELARAIDRSAQLTAQEKIIHKERDALTSYIKASMGRLKVGKMISGTWKVNYYEQSRRVIEERYLAMALLKHSIPAEVGRRILEDAVDVRSSYILRITASREEESGDQS